MALSNPIAPQPQIYFARAIDGENPAEIRFLAAQVGRELSQAGLAMVDPTSGTPLLGGQEVEYASSARAIVDHELSLLRRCDAVLMDMSIPNRNYIGCVCEMTYAHLWRIPCVVVYSGGSAQPRPWLLYHAAAIFETREAAIGHLAEVLKAGAASTNG